MKDSLNNLKLVMGLAFTAMPGGLIAQTTFTDVTTLAGFNADDTGWSHAWADYDKDGHLDVLILPHFQVFVSGAYPRLWRNDGDGSFSDVTIPAGLDTLSHDPHGVAWGDFDNDGYPDFYIAKGGLKREPVEYNELWRNNTDGTFTDIAETAGVTGINHRGRGTYAVDYNKDRNLDILSTTFFRGPPDEGNNLLYRNEGDVTFTDVAESVGLARQDLENRTAAWADVDSDRDMDVLITTPVGLFKNEGGGTFIEVTESAGLATPDQAYNGAWADYDNDGDADLYVNFFGKQGVLYQNQGGGTFVDVTSASGLINVPLSRAVGIAWGDYDNDGDLDVYVVNAINEDEPNRLFRNNGDGTFSDVTAEAQVEAQVEGRGSDANFMDYDNDGCLDLFVSNGEGNTAIAPPVLYRNNCNTNGWLKVTLKGRQSQSNRGAIGSKLALTAQGVTQYRELTGQHYMAQDAIPVHFGLGSATVIDTLTITWPSGVVQTVRNITAKRSITVGEPLAQ